MNVKLLKRLATVLSSAVAIGVLGTAAVAPAYATVTSATDQGDSAGSTSGRVCVFYAPGNWAGIEMGHVGWAVQNADTGQWVLGSADGGTDNNDSSGSSSNSSSSASGSSSGDSNSSSAQSSKSDSPASSSGSSGSFTAGDPGNRPTDAGVPHYPADLPEKVWVARSQSFNDVLNDFASFGTSWYSSYRCKDTNGGDAEAAYAEASQDGNFSFVDNNCLHHAWRALNAYKPQMLSPAPIFPSIWFANLGTTDGFDPIQQLPATA